MHGETDQIEHAMVDRRVVKARFIGRSIASVLGIGGAVLAVCVISDWMTPPRVVHTLNSMGVRDGPCVAYHSGNEIKSAEGQYLDGERHGVFTFWNRRGKVTLQLRFEKGRPGPVGDRRRTSRGRPRRGSGADRALEELRTPPWWNGARDQ